MVASNPLFGGRLSLRKKFLATVINDIWPEVFFFTLVAAMVTLVTRMTDVHLVFNSALLGVLGTVLGLVISFRTSSAYERYQDGRKMWTNIAIFCRNISQLIWIHVPNERPAKDNQRALTVLEGIIEKKSMINLVQAYAVSVKHYLRGESGAYYEDLYPLISFLPRYTSHGGQSEADMLPLWHASEDGEHPYDHTQSAPPSRTHTSSEPATLVGRPTPDRKGSWFSRSSSRRHSYFDPEKVLPTVQVHRPLKPARDPPTAGIFDYIPFLRIFKLLAAPFRRSKKDEANGRSLLGRKRKPELGDSNVPTEIILFLSNYSAYLIRTGAVQPAAAAAIVNGINSLSDTLANLERIGNTPLPFAYQAHLRMSLWIYLFFLPFQVETVMNWLTIPGTAFAAFLFLGFLEIGQEIENPFNYDLNDLDLDQFCLTIQRELHEITAHPVPNPTDFIFSAWNQPFAPADRRTAEELTKSGMGDYVHMEHGPESKPGLMSIQRTLLKAWKDVDEHTRR